MKECVMEREKPPFREASEIGWVSCTCAEETTYTQRDVS